MIAKLHSQWRYICQQLEGQPLFACHTMPFLLAMAMGEMPSPAQALHFFSPSIARHMAAADYHALPAAIAAPAKVIAVYAFLDRFSPCPGIPALSPAIIIIEMRAFAMLRAIGSGCLMQDGDSRYFGRIIFTGRHAPLLLVNASDKTAGRLCRRCV